MTQETRKFEDWLDYARKAKRVALLAHISPDGDTLGSTLALRLAFLAMGKQVDVICDGEVPDNLKFLTGSTENAKKIVKKKEKVLNLTIHMGKSHVERVGKGKCSSKLTVPFNHVLQNIGRMGNCCVNIADAVLAQSDLNEFTAFVKEEN